MTQRWVSAARRNQAAGCLGLPGAPFTCHRSGQRQTGQGEGNANSRAEYLRQWEASCAKLGPRPWLLGECGKPKVIVSDNGTELTSNAILRWADDHKIAWHYIDPGKPVQNAFAE